MISLLSVVGARPNFMKFAPIVAELKRFPAIEDCLVHSGQHYDELLSATSFRTWALPAPDVNETTKPNIIPERPVSKTQSWPWLGGLCEFSI
jgi:UDP-N-acetylglucosamine 2-epimerase